MSGMYDGAGFADCSDTACPSPVTSYCVIKVACQPTSISKHQSARESVRQYMKSFSDRR